MTSNSTLNSRNSANMKRHWSFSFCLFLFQCASHIISVRSFNIPLPGGRRIKIEAGGVVRIQLSSEQSLPPAPPIGTLPSESAISSIGVLDTGTTKGYGAFCLKPLEKFTFLGFYDGTLVVSREALETKNRSMDYVMSMDGGYTFLDGFDRAKNREVFSPVHLNHEDKGKEGCNCVRVLSEGQVAFFTSSDIDSGEELCFDYGSNYWQGRENQKI